MNMLRAFIMVGLGGAAGCMARFGITMVINRIWPHPFPWATLLINLAGCLLIGILYGTSQRNAWVYGTGWLLLATGLCGGFTTFSAFALENMKLLQGAMTASALLYMLISLAGGVVLCLAGFLLAR